MKVFRRVVYSVIGISAAVFFGLSVLAYLAQGRLLFFPTADIYRTPADSGWAYDELTVHVAGEKTSAWYVYAESDPKGIILFSHGNAGNIADRIESIGIFRSLGYDVLGYDYGGYGNSTGRASEERCYQDIRAMWRFLTEERGVAPEGIILFGRSLGAGPTCQLATEVDALAVIVESTFSSVPDRAQELFPILPAKLIVHIKFDNAAKVGSFTSPALYIHSPDDTVIPYHHGRKLFELAADPKTFFELSGDHNEGFWMAGDTYTNALEEFLDPLLDVAAKD